MNTQTAMHTNMPWKQRATRRIQAPQRARLISQQPRSRSTSRQRSRSTHNKYNQCTTVAATGCTLHYLTEPPGKNPSSLLLNCDITNRLKPSTNSRRQEIQEMSSYV